MISHVGMPWVRSRIFTAIVAGRLPRRSTTWCSSSPAGFLAAPRRLRDFTASMAFSPGCSYIGSTLGLLLTPILKAFWRAVKLLLLGPSVAACGGRRKEEEIQAAFSGQVAWSISIGTRTAAFYNGVYAEAFGTIRFWRMTDPAYARTDTAGAQAIRQSASFYLLTISFANEQINNLLLPLMMRFGEFVC